MEPIRLATEEEIESIKNTSNLTPGSSVWSMGRVIGVIRPVVELDPVYFNDASDTKKVMFMWGMENILRAQGFKEYYFNVAASEEFARQREIVVKMGAQEVSREAEIRFKKVL